MTTGASLQRSTPFSSFASKPFLESHRATSVCAREVGIVSQRLVAGAAGLHEGGIADKPVSRQMPGRCIVQLGPVAITAAWICNSQATIGQGELLVIVWRGVVAPPVDIDPERGPSRRASSSATSLWEQSFSPVGSSEDAWCWSPNGRSRDGCNSSDLATSCLERLRRAHAETPTPEADRLPPSNGLLLPARRRPR